MNLTNFLLFSPIQEKNTRISAILHVYYYNKFVIALGGEDLSKRVSYDFAIKFYDISTGKIIKRLEGHKSWIECLINIKTYFPQEKQYIVSGSDDTLIKIWSMEKLDCCITLSGHSSFVNSLLYFPQISDETLISGSKDKSIKIWNFIKGKCLKTLRGHEGSVNSLASMAIRLNNKRQAFASASTDLQIRIWEYEEYVNSADCTDIIIGHKAPITCMISVNTIKLDIIISGAKDSLIKIWDYYKKDNKCHATLKGHSGEILYIERLMSFNYNSYIASGGMDKELRIWSANSVECIETINMGSTIFSMMNFKALFRGWVAVGVEYQVRFINILETIEELDKSVKIIDATSYSSNDSLENNLKLKQEEEIIKGKYKKKNSKMSAKIMSTKDVNKAVSRRGNEMIKNKPQSSKFLFQVKK